MTYHRANTSNFQHVKYTFVYMSNTIGVIALVKSQYSHSIQMRNLKTQVIYQKLSLRIDSKRTQF